jgi:hypothetical protein
MENHFNLPKNLQIEIYKNVVYHSCYHSLAQVYHAECMLKKLGVKL